MSLQGKTISVIIPAYNEEKNITTLLKQAVKLTLPDEILVVNDGSTDKTAAMINRFQHKVAIINLPKN